MAEANYACHGEDSAEPGSAGDANGFEIMRERHHGQRRGGDNWQNDGSGLGHQRPLITTHAKRGAGHGVGGDPAPAFLPITFAFRK